MIMDVELSNVQEPQLQQREVYLSIREVALKMNYSIFFIGAKPKEIEKFILIISKAFPKLKISGFRNGYFISSSERSNTIKNIAVKNPEIIVVGLGVILQEKFLIDLVNEGWRGIGYTCGGFIHQTSQRLHYYPDWVNKLHLRMPYRLIKEPEFRKRLPRYFQFLFVIVQDYLRTIIYNQKNLLSHLINNRYERNIDQ